MEVCGAVWRWCRGVWRWCSGVWAPTGFLPAGTVLLKLILYTGTSLIQPAHLSQHMLIKGERSQKAEAHIHTVGKQKCETE